jgi:hypothetical protein
MTERLVNDATTEVTTYVDWKDHCERTALVVPAGSHGGSIDVLRSDRTRVFQINLFIAESSDGNDIVDVIVGHDHDDKRDVTVLAFQNAARKTLALKPGHAVVSIDLRPGRETYGSPV